MAGTGAAAQVPLRCGVPVAGEVAAGETDAYTFRVAEGEGVAVEAVEISQAGGDAGEVRLRVLDPAGDLIDDFCGIGLELSDLGAGSYRVEISPCAGEDHAIYSVTLTGITATLNGQPSCGALLACDSPALERTTPDQHPGSTGAFGGVDPYVIEVDATERVAISVTDVSASLGLLEMRLYDEDGRLLDDTCSGFIERRLRRGRYVVLVNDCFGVDVGRYRVAAVSERCPSPSNDSCVAAISVSGSLTTAVRTDAASASASDPVPECTGLPVDRTLWYRISQPDGGTLRADTLGSDYDTVLALYRGECGALQPVAGACNDDTESSLVSKISATLRPGESYFLMVGSFDPDPGVLVAGIEVVPAGATPTPTRTPPASGDCCTAHEGRGCVQAACQSCVCDSDGFCCSEQWDENCSARAAEECSFACLCQSAPTPTPTTSLVGCPGDCDGDAAVLVSELVRAVRIALGRTGDPADCPAADPDGDGSVSISELVRAVRAALEGCE